jgi:hypothetical protein
MNELIKELVEKSFIYDKQNDSSFFNKEKFAELIVRECMNIARNVGNISEPDDWALDILDEIEQRIQDRFGVEE